jgi:hypothetical protein
MVKVTRWPPEKTQPRSAVATKRVVKEMNTQLTLIPEGLSSQV